jgi:hypothetical protein
MREVDSLSKKQEVNAHRIVALGYAVAASLATDASGVRDRFAELVAVVAAQPEDFTTGWKFEGTLHSLGEAPELPHRDLLEGLFRAFEAADRDSLLKKLRELQEAIWRSLCRKILTSKFPSPIPLAAALPKRLQDRAEKTGLFWCRRRRAPLGGRPVGLNQLSMNLRSQGIPAWRVVN